MSDTDRAVFTTELKAEGTADTKAQADAVEKLSGEMKRQVETISKMNLAYRNLKTAGLQNTKMGLDLKARLLEQKKALGQNQVAALGMKGSFGGLSDALKKTTASSRGASSGLGALAAGASIVGGPLSSATGKTQSLVSALGKAGMIGVCIGAVAALVALDYGIIKTIVSLGKMAITSADAYRSEKLSIEGMTKVWRGFFGFMQRAPGNAALMQTAIDDVAGKVPLLRSEVVSLNAELYKYGLRGNSLKQALLAVAMGQSAAGDEGKQMGINMVAGAAMFGRSVSGAAAIMRSKFGDIVQRQMIALPVQLAKAKQGFVALFRGLQIDPLLRGLHNVLGLLDEGSATSKAWGAIFGTLFNPLFAGAERGSMTIKRMLQGVTIMALEAAIKFKQAKGAFSLKALGFGNGQELLLATIDGLASFTVGMLKAVQVSLILADGLMTIARVAQVAGKTLAAITFSGGIKNQDKAWAAADAAATAAVDQIMGPNKTISAGYNMIQGMIDGIEKGKPALIAAAKAASDAVNNTITTEQQIHSPSRKQAGFGFHMSMGQAVGIRRGIPQVVQATRDVQTKVNASMGGWSERPQSARMVASAGGGSSGPLVGELHVHLTGNRSDTVTMSMSEFRDKLAQALSGLRVQRGARS